MPIKSQARLRLFTCSSSTGDLCRIKQTAGRRRRYVTMPSSSLSAASASPTMPSSKKTLSYSTVVELHPSHTIEFGTSGIFSGRVLEMQQLGYFGNGVERAPGAEDVPELEGELVVFEAFFAASLRLPVHRFVVEVLRRLEVQIHQLTPNAMAALAVCLGCLLIRRTTICRGLREELLSTLAEKENR
jgi:hypothetical protein